MQRHLARSDARRKQQRVVRTSGPGDELRRYVVCEQHDFPASTQSVVHGLYVSLSSICLSICICVHIIHLSVYLSICLIYSFIYFSPCLTIHLSIHPSAYLFVCLSISQNGKTRDMCEDIWHVPTRDSQCRSVQPVSLVISE